MGGEQHAQDRWVTSIYASMSVEDKAVRDEKHRRERSGGELV